MFVSQILIDASNGASDYGNKFGEPLVAGYTRTFGLRMPSGDRREWVKPIMFRCVPGGCLIPPFWHFRPLTGPRLQWKSLSSGVSLPAVVLHT